MPTQPATSRFRTHLCWVRNDISGFGTEEVRVQELSPL